MTHAWPDPAEPAPRRWRALTEAEWDAVRRDYLVGVSARALCDRYEIGLSTLRLKAREGGWRRVDRPVDIDLFPDGVGPTGPDFAEEEAAFDIVVADADDCSDMTAGARSRLRRAIEAGRPAEAASWMRIYERLRIRAVAAVEAASDAPLADPPPPPPPPSPPPPAPDLLDAVIDKALRIEAVALKAARAAQSGDPAARAEVEAEVAALNAAPRLTARAIAPAEDDAPGDSAPGVSGADAALDALDSLDALDPVFSDAPVPDFDVLAERERVLMLRQRRLDHGLAVSDLDAVLTALDPHGPVVSP